MATKKKAVERTVVKKAFEMLMAHHGYNQKEMAAHLGIPPLYVSRWMNSKKGPAFGVIQFVAKSFGMKASEFVALGE